MKIVNKYSRNNGFTLLELMAVMLIMFMLMGMGTVAMKGLIKGSGISGATSNVRSVLTQARQYAIMKEQRVYVVLNNNGDKSSMTVCAQYGVCDIKNDKSDGGGYYVLTENPLPWGTNTLNGGTVYNLSNKGKCAVIGNKPGASAVYHPHPAIDKIYTGNVRMGWHKGDAVGFEVAEKRYLPSGMKFSDSTINSLKGDCIFFNPDGSAEGGSSDPIKVEIEEMYIANPTTVDFEINKLTGWIK